MKRVNRQSYFTQVQALTGRSAGGLTPPQPFMYS